MRLLTGGVAHISSIIEEDLIAREVELHKAHISGLADLSASALSSRSSNSAEWIAVMNRVNCDYKSKERYISRFLSNKLISPLAVMKAFVPEIITMSNVKGKTSILIMDQSKIYDGFECLMVSLRIGERSIPIAWKVVETKGAIGFEEQQKLLNEVAIMLPENVSILLTGDRFYGTSALIEWCKDHKWQYRIRLKSNLILEHDGGELVTGELARNKINSLENAKLHKTNIATNIGVLQEKGFNEAWIIAMDCKPSKYRVLDYGMRWGIECMFSDFKSRGFSITKTQLRHVDRIERLILVLTIALFWAVSTGMKIASDIIDKAKKKLSFSCISL